ncbi:MAG: hypothetical protein HONDAALG_02374 [Gammaproteobacteria bacterium]|nr:hypothetical protein [Gammaproteobacteria bacterium]
MANFLMDFARNHVALYLRELFYQARRQQFAVIRRIPFDENNLVNNGANVPGNGGAQPMSKVRHVIIIAPNHHRCDLTAPFVRIESQPGEAIRALGCIG